MHISSKNSTSETQDRVYHHPLIITLSLFLFLQSKSMDNEHDINRLLINLTANYKSHSNIPISYAWLCLFCKFIYINTSMFKDNCPKINKFSNSKILKPRYYFFPMFIEMIKAIINSTIKFAMLIYSYLCHTSKLQNYKDINMLHDKPKFLSKTFS